MMGVLLMSMPVGACFLWSGVGVEHDNILRLYKGEDVTLEIKGIGARQLDLMWTGTGQFGARFKQQLDEDDIRQLVGEAAT